MDEEDLSLLEQLKRNGFATRTGYSTDEMSLQKDIVNRKIEEANKPMSYSLRDALLSAIVQVTPGLMGAALAGKRGAAAGLEGGLEGGKMFNQLTENSFEARRKSDSLLAQSELEELQDMKKANLSAKEANYKNMDAQALEAIRQKGRLEVASKRGKSLGQGLSDMSNFLASQQSFLASQSGAGAGVEQPSVAEASEAALDENPQRQAFYADVVGRILTPNAPPEVVARVLSDPTAVNKMLEAVRKEQGIEEGEWDASLRSLEKKKIELTLDSVTQTIEKGRLQINNILRNSGLETEALELSNDQRRAVIEASGASLESTKLTNQQKQAALSMVDAQRQGLDLTNQQKSQSLVKGATDIESKELGLTKNKRADTAETKNLIFGPFKAKHTDKVRPDKTASAENLAGAFFKVTSGYKELNEILNNSNRLGLAGTNPELGERANVLAKQIKEGLIDLQRTDKDGNSTITQKDRDNIRASVEPITGIINQGTDWLKKAFPIRSGTIREGFQANQKYYTELGRSVAADLGYDVDDSVKVFSNASSPNDKSKVVIQRADGTFEDYLGREITPVFE